MSELDESFERLLGRLPTDAERQDLYRVRDALGLKNNDALWLVLMALQHYETQYKKIPAVIEEATSVAAENAKTQATASFNEATAKLVAGASKTIRRAIIVREWRNVLITLAVCIVVAVGMIVYTHHAGYTAGYVAGYSSGSADLVQAARWEKVSKRVIGAYLARFITDARSVTPDVGEGRSAVGRVYSMIDKDDPAYKQISTWWAGQNNPFERAGEVLVFVKVENVVQQSPSIWRVDWIETTRKRISGKILKKSRMRANLTVYVKPPESTDISNPLGIYVRDIAW